MSSALVSEIKSQKEASFNNMREKRRIWDVVEQLFHGIINDQVSLSASSRVFDPKLSTLIIERAYRVMAQMAVGKVKGISSNDLGDAKLKNLILEKYIIPNANSQFDLLTKFRIVDQYSNMYGDFVVLVDQIVKPNGYIGPDMWLLNRRDVFEQVGAVGNDADQTIIRTWRPISYFESLKPQQGFKNVGTIVSRLKDKAGSKQHRDSENKSKREEDQYPEDQAAKKLGYYEILTRFERDRWVDICVDADLEFRDQANPHDNGELPTVKKYSIPLLDDPAGLGDMERGASMQMAINANWNLYFDGVRKSIDPPILVNKDNIASISSLKPLPGAQWLVRNQINNAVMPINLNPQGIATFTTTHNIANASLQGLFGSSDTSVSKDVDQTMGKTPEALQMQQARENTRDNADKFYMEQFISQVMKKMVNLMNKKQAKSVSFRMFPDEIEQIARDYPEVKEAYNEKTGKLTVKKGSGDQLYDWEIVSGSTYSLDKKAQQENLEMLMQLYLKSQGPQGNMLVDQLKADGYVLKFGELFKRIVANTGIQDWDKILEEMTEQEKTDGILQDTENQFMQVLQAAKVQQQGVPPMPNGQMPPQPGQPQPPMGPPQGNPMAGGGFPA